MSKNESKSSAGSKPESQIVKDVIPVTKPKLKCIFVSDGVYKYVDKDGKDIT